MRAGDGFETPRDVRRRAARGVGIALALLALLALSSVPARAQVGDSSIAGLVTDTSGGVLPGVTVEATSPAIIEQTRTAITNGTGQYRIANLTPGTYAVTFTLPGFATVVREDVTLTGSFTATVNVEMRVGGLEETITVTGETPIVDVQSARRTQAIEDNVLKAIPTTRSYDSVLLLVPGITGGSNQIRLRPGMLIFSSYGGRGNEGRLQVDGINTGASLNGGGVSGYVPDVGNAEEVTFVTSGGLGEVEVGGAHMNVVPRTGGNTMSGSFFFNAAGSWSQGDNFDAAIQEAGLSAPEELIKQWDVNGAVGGPILRDRLWYFLNVRNDGAHSKVAGMFANQNAFDQSKWTYLADPNRRARSASSREMYGLRLTAQLTPRNKLGLFWDEQPYCSGSTLSPDIEGCRRAGKDWVAGGSPTSAPETAGYNDSYQRVQQVKYTSPVTNKLLVEAGFGTYLSRWGSFEQIGYPTRGFVRVQEQAGDIPGLTYRSQNPFNDWIGAHTWNASAAYVTGTHSMKFGYQGAFHVDDRTNFYNDNRLEYRLRNGVPNRLTMRFGTWDIHSRTEYDSFYGQEQWTHGRITLQGALRFDHAWSYFPEQANGPDRFVDAVVFPRTDGIKGWSDITPRMGFAYDVFGTGKTSLKVNAGQYLEAATNGQGLYSVNNPTSRVVQSTNRSWNDANADYVPDCDLRNPAANGECGPWSNQAFGGQVFATTLDPALLEGWGVRPWDWQFGVSVQHEILPRTAIELAYNRRWFGEFFVTDNLAVGPEDYDPYSITAPADPRLPDGGGYVISDLYEISEAKFGQVDNFRTSASNFGNTTAYWHGVDVNLSTRLANGLTFQGGTSTGRAIRDDCDVTPKIDNPSQRNCKVVEPWLTQFKGLVAYVVPIIDVQLAATMQSKPGILSRGGQSVATTGTSLAANWFVPNSVIEPSLGRPLSGGAAFRTIDLLNPAQMYGDRVNQFDLRIAKILRFGAMRWQVGADFYNVLNANPYTSYNQTYGANWLAPRGVLTARFVRINATVDF